jgi:hypothetical protein
MAHTMHSSYPLSPFKDDKLLQLSADPIAPPLAMIYLVITVRADMQYI